MGRRIRWPKWVIRISESKSTPSVFSGMLKLKSLFIISTRKSLFRYKQLSLQVCFLRYFDQSMDDNGSILIIRTVYRDIL